MDGRFGSLVEICVICVKSVDGYPDERLLALDGPLHCKTCTGKFEPALVLTVPR